MLARAPTARAAAGVRRAPAVPLARAAGAAHDGAAPPGEGRDGAHPGVVDARAAQQEAAIAETNAVRKKMAEEAGESTYEVLDTAGSGDVVTVPVSTTPDEAVAQIVEEQTAQAEAQAAAEEQYNRERERLMALFAAGPSQDALHAYEVALAQVHKRYWRARDRALADAHRDSRWSEHSS